MQNTKSYCNRYIGCNVIQEYTNKESYTGKLIRYIMYCNSGFKRGRIMI